MAYQYRHSETKPARGYRGWAPNPLKRVWTFLPSGVLSSPACSPAGVVSLGN